ncbi:MerR family transcriptional regulator [Rhodococcus sp. NCIMB 12038]|uniref:MerR family transcriptional regulator n=1 Tax=Rhodococcus sp. NCIMB 12038 TaxID=933800 RepID=UPI000B3CF589|nr:MerR family transcriptional regulator [Rhodococcus sp. NCIMB 12038]OUS97718.1 heavy metal-responsive transcriptional regulator [Rhodococcus sp. NCIMB 12038]
MSAYRISQLAEISRIPATTLRFYETAGLLSAERTASGYRVYGDEAVERLSFISSAKHLGLPLEEIRDLLEVWEQGVCAQVRQRMLPMVTDRIADADNRIAELSAFAARLAGVRDELTGSAPAGACGPDCGCFTATTATPVPVPLERSRPTRPPEQAWRDAPVVCTLGSGEYDERARQWRQVLSAATGREEIDGGLRVWFPSDPDLVAEVARLAAAEQSCCAFFDFTMQLAPDRLTVTVRAPAAAGDLLSELFG